MAASSAPVAPGLFTWPSDKPCLLGGRCTACGAVAFPRPLSCARCAGVDVEMLELPRRGTLWTFTIQGFAPKRPPYAGPEPFEPYGVGYVDLGAVKVEGRLTEADPDRLRIGMPMEVVVVPFSTDDEGNEVVTFAFAPVDATEPAQGS